MILVDTPIWSLALQRREGDLNPEQRGHVDEWKHLVREGRAGLVGPIRQELLSGVRSEEAWEQLKTALRPFLDLRITTPDYERASQLFNRCRARGITGSSIDLIICAVAQRFDIPIYTTDTDFVRYTEVLELRLHSPAGTA